MKPAAESAIENAPLPHARAAAPGVLGHAVLHIKSLPARATVRRVGLQVLQRVGK